MSPGGSLAATVRAGGYPRRIRERSERLLPRPGFLARLADELAAAVRPAEELPCPTDTAVQLAALAGQLRAAAGHRAASG